MRPLQEELKTITIEAPQHFRNLTLFPLKRPGPAADGPGYLLLDEALRSGIARISELGGGTVPELRFENRSELPVLLLDGEELVGAKQNRVLNLTILAPAKAAIVIPVSCVEAGRWQMASEEFRPVPHMMFARARASRVQQVTDSMRSSGTRRSDQAAVWSEIASKAARMDACSPTQAMSAVFERHADSVEEYVRAFSCVAGQTGVLFASGGAYGLDLFDHPATMRSVFGKLLRSYALDAIETGPEPAAGIPEATRFLEEAGSATETSGPAAGLGKDVRLSGRGVAGAALWAEGRYVHICGFTGRGTGKGGLETRLSRPSRRRATM